MQYIDIIRKQPADKTALITETATYTYGELWQQAMEIRKTIAPDETVHIIGSQSIAAQLCQFLVYSGSTAVPVMATAAGAVQRSESLRAPQTACMGVMTSGSTGPSKILWRDYASWADFFPVQNRLFGITSETILFCQGSLAFTGNLNIYLGVLAAGGTILGADSFHPKTWLALMETYQANAVYLIPAKLLLLPQTARRIYKTVQHIISGSQALGKPQAQWLQQTFPQSEIILYYGASELNYITYIKDTDMTEDTSIVGKPFPGVSIAIGAAQEILVMTPYHVLGITVPFSLHDNGQIDRAGNLHFLGRSGDSCNVNGRHVSTYRIEQALCAHLPIREAAVWVEHGTYADSLTAALGGAASPISRTAFLKRMRPYLQTYEIPKTCIFADSLPKNESGKIDKQALKRRHLFPQSE